MIPAEAWRVNIHCSSIFQKDELVSIESVESTSALSNHLNLKDRATDLLGLNDYSVALKH